MSLLNNDIYTIPYLQKKYKENECIPNPFQRFCKTI